MLPWVQELYQPLVALVDALEGPQQEGLRASVGPLRPQHQLSLAGASLEPLRRTKVVAHLQQIARLQQTRRLPASVLLGVLLQHQPGAGGQQLEENLSQRRLVHCRRAQHFAPQQRSCCELALVLVVHLVRALPVLRLTGACSSYSCSSAASTGLP